MNIPHGQGNNETLSLIMRKLRQSIPSNHGTTNETISCVILQNRKTLKHPHIFMKLGNNIQRNQQHYSNNIFSLPICSLLQHQTAGVKQIRVKNNNCKINNIACFIGTLWSVNSRISPPPFSGFPLSRNAVAVLMLLNWKNFKP